MEIDRISGFVMPLRIVTYTGVYNAELDSIMFGHLQPITKYKCLYCQVWVEYGIGLCKCCGAFLPNLPTLINP